MDDIAKEVGISKKTIYQHISDKKTLIKETLEDFLVEDREYVLAAIERKDCNALDKMIIIAEKGLEIFKKIRPTLIYDLQKYHKECWLMIETDHFAFMKSVIKKNILEGIKEDVYREDVDADIISRLFVVLMITLNDEDHFPSSKHPKAHLFLQQMMYHLHGIVNKKHFIELESRAKKIQQIITVK